MEAYLLWFEELCTSLNTNPKAATAALGQFKNSDDAHQLSIHFLSNSRRNDVKFQALLILRHTLVTNWAMFTSEGVAEFQLFLWRSISSESATEAYVLNKLIEVYALSAKKSWLKDSYEKRKGYFRLLEQLMAGAPAAAEDRSLYVAGKVLHAIVENLTSVDDFGMGLTVAELGHLRKTFVHGADGSSAAGPEMAGLMMAADLSISILKRVHALTEPFEAAVLSRAAAPEAAPGEEVAIADGQLIDVALAITEISETVTCVLRLCESNSSSAMDSVDVDGRTAVGIGGKGFSAGSSGRADGRQATEPCHSWLPLFLSHDMVTAVFQLHHRIRNVLLAIHFPTAALRIIAGTLALSPTGITRTLCTCLGSIGGMLLSLASVDAGMAFTTYDQKIKFVDALLSSALGYLEASVSPSPAGNSPHSDHMFSLLFFMNDDGEYSLQEFAHGSDLIMRIIGNFKLFVVSGLPSFERAIGFLSRLVREATRLALLCCSENAPDDEYFAKIRVRYAHLVEVSDSPLGGPLVDVLLSCLDVWGMVLGDSMLQRPVLALPEGEAAAATRLRNGFRELCGHMFTELYQCVVSVIILDTLKSEDEELDIESEEIFERNVSSLISGVSDIGRMSAFSALQHISSCLGSSIQQLDNMYSQLTAGSEVGERVLRVEVTKALEIQRLSVEFLSCLLIESGGGSRLDRVASGRSTEIPLISSTVLDSFNRSLGTGGEVDQLVVQVVSLALQALQQQCRFHTASSDPASRASLMPQQNLFFDAAGSAIVVQGVLYFLADYTWAYVDPRADMYEVSPQLVCPNLIAAMSTGGSFNSAFLEPVLQMSLYCARTLGGGNHDLVAAAISVLKCLAKLERLPVLGALPIVHQYVEYARDTICPMAKQVQGREVICSADCSLSVCNQSLLWENLGFMAHELAVSSIDAVAATGMVYITKLCSFLECGIEWSSKRASGVELEGSLLEGLLYLSAAYRGFVRCTTSLSPTVLSFVQRSVLHLYELVHRALEPSARNGNTVGGSRLLGEWLGLLSDFAEATPLSSLPFSSLQAVMVTARGTLLTTVFNHLRLLRPVYDSQKNVVCSENTYDLCGLFIDILSGSLVYLDHIASSDVAVSIRSIGGIATDAPGRCSRTSVEVDELLCVALLMLSSEVVTTEILKTYHQIQDKYLSLVNLILRSHPVALGVQWLSLGNGLTELEGMKSKIATLQNMLVQVMLSVDSCDSSAGRVALLSLKSFGVFYKKISTSQLGIPREYAELCHRLINESAQMFLHQSLSYLLDLILPAPVGNSRFMESGEQADLMTSNLPLIRLKDRVDTFASTLLELARIDSGQRLSILTAECISRRSAVVGSTAPDLHRCLEKLFTARNVSLENSTKLNERNFILNMRDCLTELQSMYQSVQ